MRAQAKAEAEVAAMKREMSMLKKRKSQSGMNGKQQQTAPKSQGCSIL